MKFSLVTIACAFTSLATAAPSAVVEKSIIPAPQLPAGSALTLVNTLNKVLEGHSAKINKTIATIHTGSADADKKNAVQAVGAEMNAMTLAITKTVGELGHKARTGKLTRRDILEERAGGGEAQALAKALQHTLVTLAGTVNTALAVLGLTPLLAFLTPLTGSLSGLVLTLKAVVDSLLPLLNTLLDGVVLGLTGLLAGLIL